MKSGKSLKKSAQTKRDSLEYAIIRDQLIQKKKLPDDPIVESNDDYWDQFKQSSYKIKKCTAYFQRGAVHFFH